VLQPQDRPEQITQGDGGEGWKDLVREVGDGGKIWATGSWALLGPASNWLGQKDAIPIGENQSAPLPRENLGGCGRRLFYWEKEHNITYLPVIPRWNSQIEVFFTIISGSIGWQ
jgi:hypothetical protein